MKTLNSPAIYSALRHALTGRETADLGQFQLINLDLVRQKTGERWECLKAKVLEVSAHFIEKRITSDDVLVRCNDGFLVVFASLDPAEAAAKTQQIALEMNTFFLGDELLKHLNIRSSATRMSVADISTMMAGPAPEKMIAEKPEITAGSPEDAPVRKRSNVIGVDFKREHSVVYRPVWDALNEAITTQFCVPKLVEGKARRIYYGYDTLRGRSSARDCLELDLEIADSALSAFQRLYADGRPTSLCLPVALATLTQRSTRIRYFETLAAIPETLRKFFLLRVHGLSDGVPASTIQDVFRTLRPFAGSIAAHAGRNIDFAPDRFASCGIQVFSGEVAPGPVIPDGRWAGSITGFARKTGQLGAAACLEGVNSVEDMDQARHFGVRFFAGGAIGNELDAPVVPHLLRLEELRRLGAHQHMV